MSKNKNKQTISSDTLNLNKSKNRGIRFNIFKRSKKTKDMKYSSKNASKKKKSSNAKSYLMGENSENSNIYFLYNQDIPRKLSVIIEERPSCISTRSNSADHTQVYTE